MASSRSSAPGSRTDSGGVLLGASPHPRLCGTFPRVRGRCSREFELFPPDTAVWRTTGLTARNFGLDGRGRAAEGACADLALFDAATAADAATDEDPLQPRRCGRRLEFVFFQPV